MQHGKYWCEILEINVGMVVTPVLCLIKDEATEVNLNIHQRSICIREIQ